MPAAARYDGEQLGFRSTVIRKGYTTTMCGSYGKRVSSDRMDEQDRRRCSMSIWTQRVAHVLTRYRIALKQERFDSWMGFRQGRAAMPIEGIYILSSLEEHVQ